MRNVHKVPKVLFLGVVSRGKPGSNHIKEIGRVALALERLWVPGSQGV